MHQFECCLAKDAFSTEKAEILKGWDERKRRLIKLGAKGGLGYVDPDIVPLCDALNQLPGVCTLQSCAGHSAEDSDGAIYPGELWLRLGPGIKGRFEAAARQLAANTLIDRVGKIYWEDGKETVTVIFKGNESGHLAQSSVVLLKFFEKLHI